MKRTITRSEADTIVMLARQAERASIDAAACRTRTDFDKWRQAEAALAAKLAFLFGESDD